MTELNIVLGGPDLINQKAFKRGCVGAERNNHDWKLYEMKPGIFGHKKGLSFFNGISNVAQG